MITGEQAKKARWQHNTPCHDCPWRRNAIAGWTGDKSPDEWLQMAHGETKVMCHCIGNQQCAGLAMYRANVCKIPRDSSILTLGENIATVFKSKEEFKEHHERKQRV